MARDQARAWAWPFGAGAVLTVTAPAQAVTGQELLGQCEALERGAVVSGETVRLPKGQAAAACWVYMGAVQDFAATVEEEGGPSLIGSCVPAEATRIELVRAFTRYARAHRADPCPARDRARHPGPERRLSVWAGARRLGAAARLMGRTSVQPTSGEQKRGHRDGALEGAQREGGAGVANARDPIQALAQEALVVL